MFTQTKRGILLSLISAILSFYISGCAVYTVDKTQLEAKLKPASVAVKHKGLGLNKLTAMYKKHYNNKIDSLVCQDKIGKLKVRHLSADSKITVITTTNKTVNFYAKTLYILNDEYLIGERTTINLRRFNGGMVKLKDIARIEVRG